MATTQDSKELASNLIMLAVEKGRAEFINHADSAVRSATVEIDGKMFEISITVNEQTKDQYDFGT